MRGRFHELLLLQRHEVVDTEGRVTRELGHFVIVPTSRPSDSVLVGMDLADGFLCCAHCPQKLRLLSLRIHLPVLSIFLDFSHFDHVSLLFISFPFRHFSFLRLEAFVNLIFPSLFWSSPWSVWCLVLRPWFHFAAFFVHRSSSSDAVLIVKRHFILFCVSIQHGIFAVFVLSTAISVLLLLLLHFHRFCWAGFSSILYRKL